METGRPQHGTVRTTCPYCGVGCGVLATPRPDGSVDIKGDPDHPANYGRLCSKGTALGDTLGLDGRLLHPEVDGRQAAWDEALDTVAARFQQTIAEHGSDSVAFYLSGQLLTEDYYVANKLMKGYIGSANIDTNSRLCMSSSVAGHRRAFGSDTVPGTYEDLELADLLVLTGSNLAWCHPVLYQRIAAAKERRPAMKVVVVDPRRTATCDIADLHLAIRPDTDVELFLGLLAYVDRHGAVARDWSAAHVSGLQDAMAAARGVTVELARQSCGISREDLEAFYLLFTQTEKTVTVFSQGVNQSARGTDKVNAIINCHLATGRIGRPGMGPFSITGQPNAMGGREVGGLANMLAGHMDIENADHRALVQRFWSSPVMAARPGLKAVDMFRAVKDGRIKALWIMATNPAVSMPEADAVRDAIAACPFVVVSDVVRRTDTVNLAHVRLPAAAWGEKDGTVTNSDRRISRQRAFLAAPGEARPDWWIMSEIARRMGHGAAFVWPGPSGIFAEHAALSGCENDGRRDFDISAHAGISAFAYAALEPFQWPAPRDGTSRQRFFANGGFYTLDRKARAVAIQPSAQTTSTLDTFTLNTGRVRDHWHTMTRTGQSARLSVHLAEPYCEINPADAAALGIKDASLVRLSNDHGQAVLRALITPGVQPRTIFAPMHWSAENSSLGRIDALVPAITDASSGQPASKHAQASVTPYAVSSYGFAITAHRPSTHLGDYWAIARTEGGWRVEFALESAPRDVEAIARQLAGPEGDFDVITAADSGGGSCRIACFAGDKLLSAVFLSPDPVALSRGAVAMALTRKHHDRMVRHRIIAGRGDALSRDPGPIVCACNRVGRNDIGAAIASGCSNVAMIGEATGAGTNCGSCRSEISELLRLTVTAQLQEAC